MKYKAQIYLTLLIVIFIILAARFTNIFVYFVISGVVATILRPMTNYLNQTQFMGLRIPRFISVLVSYSFLIGVFSLFVILFIPVVSAQIDVLAGLDYESILSRIAKPLESFEAFLINNSLTDRSQGFLSEEMKNSFRNFVIDINFTDIINSVFSFTGLFLVGLMAVLFISFFLLYEDSMLRRNFVALIPNSYFEVSIAAIAKIEMLLSNYLVGLLIQMISIFTIVSVGLSILNIKFALTIALFAAVANLIPYLGPLLGASFGVIVSISTSPGILATPNDYFLSIAKILLVFGIVQLIDNMVLQPLIFSRSVKAHPLEIFVVIFVGASIAQIPGMIIAIPAYTVLRVSVKEFYTGYKQYRIFRIN